MTQDQTAPAEQELPHFTELLEAALSLGLLAIIFVLIVAGFFACAILVKKFFDMMS